MFLLDLLFGPRRSTISHKNSESFVLATIADNTDLVREGSGLTVITSVGCDVKLHIQDNGSLAVRGNIGNGCSIYKDGNGTLTIEGTVADNLKLTVYGQGPVIFRHRPPESVIRAIKNCGGIAQIICAGVVLPRPNQAYIRHNLGVVARQQPMPQQNANPPQFFPLPPPQQTVSAVDQYSELTRTYIEAYRAHHHQTIEERIKALGDLTAEEESLFESFTDSIMMNYFDDIPVEHNEKYYSLSTLLKIYETNKRDSCTRAPLKLADIQPARKVLSNFDEVLNSVQAKRSKAAKNSMVSQGEAIEAQAHFRQ